MTPLEEFHDILKGKGWWARVLNTQFANGIALFVSQMALRRLNWPQSETTGLNLNHFS